MEVLPRPVKWSGICRAKGSCNWAKGFNNSTKGSNNWAKGFSHGYKALNSDSPPPPHKAPGNKQSLQLTKSL